MKLDTLKTIFYIYSDATMAAIMTTAFIIELLCAMVLPEAFLIVTIPATILFCIGAAYLTASVYSDAKKSKII